MMMALPQNQSNTGRGLLIITATTDVVVLILHVTHHGITTGNVMPMSKESMQSFHIYFKHYQYSHTVILVSKCHLIFCDSFHERSH